MRRAAVVGENPADIGKLWGGADPGAVRDAPSRRVRADVTPNRHRPPSTHCDACAAYSHRFTCPNRNSHCHAHPKPNAERLGER